jgi:ketosteroid isomerase-like protein
MTKNYLAVLAILAVVLLALANLKPASAIQRDTPATLMNLETQFMNAAAAKGSAGYMSYYAEDAVELPNGADAIQGKANIAQTMGFLDQGNKLTWKPDFSDMAASGDLGYTYGTYVFTSKDKDKDGKPVVEYGKYLTVWKKQSDGTWKVAVDMGNASAKPKS